ncbi:MAG: response regulator transcription factor [Planctomycetes bacterium]|nr:response regulator transcription factor [Planctomycetota bacterium]
MSYDEPSSDHTPVSIYLVEDGSLVRAGFRALLEQKPGIEVVGENSDAREAVREVRNIKPDVVVMDITMPGLSGVDAISPIKAASPSTKVLMASHHQGFQFVRQALKAGADGYVTKNSNADEFLFAIDAVRKGDSYVSPKVAGALVESLRSEDPIAMSPLESLTAREREVLQLIAIGKANKEVAAELHVSLSTVKKHRENLQRKLDCHCAAELARLAIREGLLNV